MTAGAFDSTTKPVNCPQCQTELRDPHPSTSRKAKRLRIISMAVTPLWVVAMWWAAGLGAFDFADGLSDRTRSNAGMALFALPLLAGLWLTRLFPRVLPFECYRCGWKYDYPLGSTTRYDV